MITSTRNTRAYIDDTSSGSLVLKAERTSYVTAPLFPFRHKLLHRTCEYFIRRSGYSCVVLCTLESRENISKRSELHIWK